jgi:ParB-like chromosome segregation protein Spo0J
MEIKNKKIKEIKEAEYNPRKISDDELSKLKKSIKSFGIVRPLIVNIRTGNLVSGHQTLAASRILGLKEVPTIEIDVDEKQEKVLNIGLNKISGEWDYDKLNGLLEEIKELDVFDCTGFDKTDVDLMEKLSDDGSLVSEGSEPVKKESFKIIFDFEDENEMIKVKKYFSNAKNGWKDKNKPNSNLLKKIIEDKSNELG